MFVFGAITAAGAQAEMQVSTCAKASKNPISKKFEGVYTDKLCTIPSGRKKASTNSNRSVKRKK